MSERRAETELLRAELEVFAAKVEQLTRANWELHRAVSAREAEIERLRKDSKL